MAEPHPQDSFAKKEKESDNYSDDLGIEDLLDTEWRSSLISVLLVAARLLVYHPQTFFQLQIVRDLTAVYSLMTTFEVWVTLHNSRPQNHGPTTTSEEPDIHGQKKIRGVKKHKFLSQLGSTSIGFKDKVGGADKTFISYSK